MVEAAGSFLGLAGSFKLVYDYVKDSREVDARLKRVLLTPLEKYQKSMSDCEKSSQALRNTVDNLKTPLTNPSAENLIERMIDFSNDFSDVLSSVLAFSKVCNIVISDYAPFMEDRVKTKKRDVYMIVNFFGKYYDPKTDTLTLTNLPTFVQMYGPKKLAWKESEELSQTAAAGDKTVKGAIRKASVIKRQRLHHVDRRLRRDFPRSFSRLLRETSRFKSSNEVARELSRNAPSWLVNLTGVIETAQKAV